MVDAREAAHDAANKLMSKSSRWRTKIFSNNSHDDAPVKPEVKPAASFKLDEDVNAFLKPSTDKAQQQRDAAASYMTSSNRPRIDVARAQRWPGAQEVLRSAAALPPSPGPGGLRTSTRKKGLSVGFVRTVPEIIGHGGDECEEPAAEVSKRKQSRTSAAQQPQPQKPQDDANLNTSVGRTLSQTEQRNSLTRTMTSHGETSPPLDKKLEMGSINTYAQALPPTPQRMGPMGLGGRPKPLSRAPTGFDLIQTDLMPRRPSDGSAYSQDSDNTSPVLARKASNKEPTIQEEDNFRPKPLARTPTGFHDMGDTAPQEPPQPMPRLPEMNVVTQEDDSPLDNSVMLAERFLESEPTEANSFAARLKQRMRSEEGRALHEAAQRQASERDSDTSSMRSLEPPQHAPSSSSFQPQPASGRTPPQAGHELPHKASPPRTLGAEDPHRSRARVVPSPRPEPYSAPSAQPTPPVTEKPSFVAFSQQHPPGARPEQGAASVSSSHPGPPTLPPQLLPGAQLPVRPRQEPNERSAASLGRSDTRSLGEVAFRDFADRVIHMKGIFQLTAQLGGSIYDRTPIQWLRVATWWFLKGRAGMETLIRNRPQSDDPPMDRLTQPHVDLAKVLWILTEVIPNHPGLQQYAGQTAEGQGDRARKAGDAASAEVFEIQSAILHYMKLLVGSMKKHQSMPPTQALIQGQDQSVWEEYPPFAPDAASVLQAGIPRLDSATGNNTAVPKLGLSQYIPLADTKGEFCYFRMFVKASLSTDDPNTDRVPMPAIVSVLRPKDLFQVKLAICSQNDTINIMLGPNADGGPSWSDVNWKKQSNQISVTLQHSFVLTLELSEGDWRNLWAIFDHTNRVQMDLRERKDERFACKLQLREASYRDPGNPSAFPQGRVQGCKLIVFEKIERSSEGTGKRKLHRGFRMALSTNQQSKQVSLVNLEMGTKQAPVNFEYVTEPDQTPGMRLAFQEEVADKKPRVCAAHLIFQESKDRNHLFGTFTSMNIGKGETVFAQVPLKSFHIESADQADGFSQKGSRVLERLAWQEAKVLNQDPEAAGLESAPTVMSESLRIVCRHSAGIIADRMNLGPGELLVRLPIDGAAELTLLREAQQDVTMAIDSSRTKPDVPDSLGELLKTLHAASTVRRLTFNSFKDLHAFQFAVTGFEVKFDGIASSFSISRRRMVVPIYKQWTANTIRIQVVQQDNIIQLLAFFEEFSHADAMNFQLRTMDTFEKSDKGGKFGLKLVDAKFALPVEERRGEGKMQKEEGKLTGWAGTKRKFVCLDEIEYPGEHDDILIQFDLAETRDTFAAALPSATMERKFTLRRKI